MPTLPTKLRAARLLAGLRLFDVQQATGISESRLSRIERGELAARPHELAQLARLYGTTPENIGSGVRARWSVEGAPVAFRVVGLQEMTHGRAVATWPDEGVPGVHGCAPGASTSNQEVA